jgi:hypothetical protein
MNRFILIVALGCLAGCGRPLPPKGSDMEARDRLLARIGDINDFTRPRPLVTLEEFFEGNDDPGSIGYNLPDPPAPREFYELLLAIRNRPGVSDVRIEVKDLEDPDGWPSTDTLWIITTATPQEIRSWFPQRFAPDEVIDGFEGSPSAVETYAIPKGMRAVGIWYD